MDQETSQPTSHPESLGSELRKAREEKGVSLKYISDHTNIREVYLKALEDDNHNIFPSRAYLVGFVRNYSKCIGLDAEPLIQKYNPTVNPKDEIKILERLAKQKFPKTKTAVASKIRIAVLTLIILVLAASVFLTVYHRLWDKIEFPKLRLTEINPKNSTLTASRRFEPTSASSSTPKIAIQKELNPSQPPLGLKSEGDTIRLTGMEKGSCWVALKKFRVDEDGSEKPTEYVNDLILRNGVVKSLTLTDKSEIVEISIQNQFVKVEFNQKPFQLPEETSYPVILRMEKGELFIK